jgi:hypothetical protein
MNLDKVIFGFFIVLSLTLNFSFYVGEIGNPAHHPMQELLAVIIVNLIATVLKFGDKTQLGAVMLATSLVALLQLFAAALTWAYAAHVSTDGLTQMMMVSIVSLAGGAMVANIVSVLLLLVETVMLKR